MKHLPPRREALALRHPKIARVMSSAEARTDATLVLGATSSLLFTIFCLISSRFSNPIWFLTLGLYNFSLGILRLFLAAAIRRGIRFPQTATPERERHACIVAGVLMLLFSLVFSAMSMQHLLRNASSPLPGPVLALLILFTALRLLMCLFFAGLHRRAGSTLMHAVDRLNLVVAVSSLYTTQDGILLSLGLSEIPVMLLNLLTCSLVLTLQLRLSVRMITEACSAPSR